MYGILVLQLLHNGGFTMYVLCKRCPLYLPIMGIPNGSALPQDDIAVLDIGIWDDLLCSGPVCLPNDVLGMSMPLPIPESLSQASVLQAQ